MKKSFVYISVAAFLFSCSGSEDNSGNTPPPPSPEQGNIIGTADVWITNGEQTKLLSKQVSGASVYDTNATTDPSISVDFSQQYQEIEGFGAALTGSSANVINALPASQKEALLKDLFSATQGIGLSYLRLTIGASDFSLNNFSYDDVPAGSTDAQLANFSIAPDETDVIPVLQSILAYAPNIKIMGSPWSAPAWMKDTKTMNGGSLETQWHDAYGNYFVKYINAYAAHGITINAVSPQNEPLHQTTGYPTMYMTALQQADFIKNSLGPKFQQAGINTKIIAYDHNFDRTDYPLSVLGDAGAAQYVDGAAFHAYGGDVSAMTQVHSAFPEKNVYFTEVSGGGWSTNFTDNLKWGVGNILIGTTRNWSKNVLLWNLALNAGHGPTNGGCMDCRGVVTVSPSGAVVKNVEYYMLAHFSKFVKPGAKRVNSTNFDNSLAMKNVAFINPDGSKVLVVLNESATTRKFAVKLDNKRISYSLEANAAATFVWQ